MNPGPLRRLIVGLIVSVLFDIGLSVGLFVAVRQANDNTAALAKIANNAIAECNAANDSAIKQHQLWDGLLSLPKAPDAPPPPIRCRSPRSSSCLMTRS